VLTGARQHGADVEDGLASVRAMAAIAQSVRTGQAIEVGMMTGAV
jgi:hypothetical protein